MIRAVPRPPPSSSRSPRAAQTIADFKKGDCTLMVATSVAGRGLDVPELCCVINYACPNHLEDYVHRVGRTGRAGRKGTAYTFISPKDEEQFAPLLVKALTQAKQTVPPELTALADKFKSKVAAGEARWAASGFKGKGFTFDGDEMTEEQKVADLQKKQTEVEMGLRDASDLLPEETRKALQAEADRKVRENEQPTAYWASAPKPFVRAMGGPHRRTEKGTPILFIYRKNAVWM